MVTTDIAFLHHHFLVNQCITMSILLVLVFITQGDPLVYLLPW